jgi:hypothetical protein
METPPIRISPLYCITYAEVNDSDGNIVPCNVLANKTRISFGDQSNVTETIIWGNVLKNDPAAVWNNSGYQWFRQLFHMGILPTNCRLCAMAYGVIC